MPRQWRVRQEGGAQIEPATFRGHIPQAFDNGLVRAKVAPDFVSAVIIS